MNPLYQPKMKTPFLLKRNFKINMEPFDTVFPHTLNLSISLFLFCFRTESCIMLNMEENICHR